MTSFFVRHLVEIYVLYGTSFIVLGVALYLQPRLTDCQPFHANFPWLSAFALLHGLAEYLDIWIKAASPVAPPATWIHALLLIASFLFLSEFARRSMAQQLHSVFSSWKWLISPWVYVLLGAILTILALVYSVVGLQAGARILLCLPSAAVTGWLFMRVQPLSESADDSSPQKLTAYFAGGAFATYAVLAGGFISAWGQSPAWLPTDRAFLAATGLPIQLLRGVCALITAAAVTKLVRLQVDEATAREQRITNDLRALTISLEERVATRTTDLEMINRQLAANIAERDQAASRLLYLAEHDALTGSCNRHCFEERLAQIISAAGRSGARISVLYLDLDEFKYINDTYGHSAGDAVLVRVAHEIKNLVRSGDVVARLGGDEFAVLAPLYEGDDPSALPKRIVAAVSNLPMRLRGGNHQLTTSIGIALFPDHGRTLDELITHADTAMYQAKQRGKNTWFIYDPSRDLAEATATRLTWTGRIRDAIDHDLFELHFQGVYRANNRHLGHLEVLIRMRDQEDPARLVMPGQFIRHAEKSGLIIELDRWVIRRSIELLKTHPRFGALAVNVSGRSIEDGSLPGFVKEQLAEYGVDPNRLIIELTETAAFSDMEDALRFIETVRVAGCRVALDDFGSGFSTFIYLKHLGVDIIKIDGAFIRDLLHHRDSQVIVKAMVEVATELRKTTIAESIEDQATLNMVRDLGVDWVQGYYLDRPDSDISRKIDAAEPDWSPAQAVGG